MSDIKDRLYEVTWRSVSQTIGATEYIAKHRVTAAYWLRDGALIVFKKDDGTMVFSIAECLVETIEMLPATGGVIPAEQAPWVSDDTPPSEVLPGQQIAEAGREITTNVTGSVISEAELAATFRRGIVRQRRNPGTAAA